MANINDAVTPTQILKIESSGGARVLLYGPDGSPLVYASNYERAVANVRVLASAATTINTVWALRNTNASRILYITSILLQMGFNGTGAATEQQWEVSKATGVTAMTGGSAVTAAYKRTSLGGPDVDARVADTGVTLTGGAITNPFWSAWCQRLTHSATQAGNFLNPVQILADNEMPIELAYQEALIIRSLKTQVIGDILEGGVEFYGG